MVAMWCIKCQAEQDHSYFYGQEPCREGGSCEHRCRACNMNTLAYIQSSPNHSEREVVMQMVGEAQRVAQSTGRIGDIEVLRESRNSVSGEFETKILVYNTNTGFYRVRNQ